jgi:small subunit ribosomal protein S1
MGAMDVRYVEDPQSFVGQSLEFLVTELRGSRDVVLSRRRLLEREREVAAAETRERLQVGARLRGVVTNVRDFGAFVDLGGIEGLVPASELGFGRIRPEERVETGQSLEVEVLRLETDDKGRERITLSLKSLMDDPFDAVAQELQPGLVVLGTVTRLQPFGAFVQLLPGVEGLIHVSAFGRRIGHPQEAVSEGQEVAVRVDSVDAEQRRIGLHLLPDEAPATAPAPGASGLRVLRLAELPVAREEAPAGEAPRVGDVFEVTVDRAKRFGVFVSWPGGKGLVPNRELGVGHGEDPGRKFPEGTSFKAAVTEVREDGKVTLSKEGAARAEEKKEAEAWKKRSSSTPGLGTLGDLLKAKRRH